MMSCGIANSNQTGRLGSNGYGINGRLGPGRGYFKCTPILDHVAFKLEGEYGTGGRPLIRKVANPYLEVDLVDPDDQILFQGELQKYKPGFNGVFIDRWV